MKNFFALLTRKNLYNLIPEDQPVSRQQFVLFRIFSFTGAFVCIGVSAKMLLTIVNAGYLPWMILALCMVMMFNFYNIKNPAGLRKAYLVMLCSAVALLHLVSYSCGGIRTAGTLYFGVIILYAYMLLGRKSGKAFTIFVIAHVAYLFIVSTFTDWTSFSFFKNDITLINEDFLINAIMSFVLIAVQGNYLQSNKNEVIQDLDKKRILLEEKNRILEEKNELLNSYAHNLEKTNAELRKFASVAAHDLKAPLRAIGSLTGFIEDEEQQFKGEQTQEFFNLIKSRVNRMDQLLDALLEYSTVSDAVSVPAIFNPEVIIQKQALAFKSHDVEISIYGHFPLLFIDQKHFAKVVAALLKNAVLFNDKHIKKIAICGRFAGSEYFIDVTDNGPGIDSAFHEKIFIIFQTLQPRDTLETMGVGLPVSRKIAETWNGGVTIASRPGEGATFSIRIPNNLVRGKVGSEEINLASN
ncbi:MAG: hypothetical protein IPN13_15660 [Bacteroidetes bacterium]|nr:hypothetical protein [Bacteroidota bacterium]